MVPVAPIVVTGLGASVAGVGYWLHKTGKLAGLFGKANPKSSVSAATGGSPAAAPSAPAKSANETNLGTALKPQYQDYTQQVQAEGKAVAPAKALYTYLKTIGQTETPELKALVMAFQKAHNSDKLGKGLGGQLSEDGLYGPGTSAALTMYTNDPIPGNPKYQPRAATTGEILTNKVIGENGSNAGVAFQSQFNLIQHLRKKGYDGSSTLAALTKQFQHDVNTDPLFPGPAFKPSPKPPVLHPAMSEDGILGPKSKGVLLFGANDDDFAFIAKALKSIGNDGYYMDLLTKAGRPVGLL